MGRLAVAGALSVLLTAAVIALPAAAGSGLKTELVSRTSSGEPATDGDSVDASTSSSGRFVAFSSQADNLPGDDSVFGIYVRDRKADKTRLVSRTSGGAPADGDSFDPSISASGRFVAFHSEADNLPGNDNFADVYVHDRETGKTKLISKTSGGDPADADSVRPSTSASGRFVAFRSRADNLPGDAGVQDVYVHDRKTGKTKLISKTSGGDPADGASFDPSISASGRFVAFPSNADNLPGDDNFSDVYVHDRKAGKTKLISKTSGGAPADGNSFSSSASASGRIVAFASEADNLPGAGLVEDIYVHDRKTGKTRLVSKTSAGEPLNDDSNETSISASGRMVAFESVADNVPGGGIEDVYVHDRRTGKTKLVNRNSDGDPAFDDASFKPSVSGNGLFVAFNSGAFNLGGAGDDSFEDVYIRGPFG